MPLTTTEQRSHRRGIHPFAIAAFSFCPEQSDRIVWRVVIKYQRQGAPSITQSEMRHAPDISVFRPDDRIVIYLGKFDKSVVAPRDRSKRKIASQNGTKRQMNRVRPAIAGQNRPCLILPFCHCLRRSGASYPTSGPEHRFSTVLFIEKEGFAPLLEAAQIAERFDIAIMSTKGMSTTAARLLLDRLAPRIHKVLVLHDFDVSGFSIFGALGSDGRRYRFENNLPIVDIGLRPGDVETMALQAEPVETQGSWASRSRTLAEHGATSGEIKFLRTRRVELNAMTAPVFVGFLERKLAEHEVQKVVPDDGILERHARRLIEQGLAKKVLDKARPTLQLEAAATALPDDLHGRVRAALVERPELSWDLAVATLIAGDKPERRRQT